MNYKEIMLDADNLYESAELAIKTARNKYQTKKFAFHIYDHIKEAQEELESQTWKVEQVRPFIISERGHKRKIQGNTPHDRMIMNCFCNRILIPSLDRYLIYDNYASRDGKGTSQCRERFEHFLHTAYRIYGGNNFYVLTLDISKYYDNMIHDKIKEKILPKLNNDSYAEYMMDTILDSFKVNVSWMSEEEYSNCLNIKYVSLDHLYDIIDIENPKYMHKSVNIGALPSQSISTYFPSEHVDNYFKYVKGIKMYGRFQDDVFIISNNKEFLRECMTEFDIKLSQDGLFMNYKKSQIHPVSRDFKFLNRIYRMTDSGRLIILLSTDTVLREKKKLKKLHELYIEGEKEFKLIENQYRSWRESFRKYMTDSQLNSLDNLYNELFIIPFMKGGGI